MIKPDAVGNGHIGAILNKIAEAGFTFKALKMTRLSQTAAEAFYAVHNERPFFNDLVSFMTSGPIVAAVLEKDNAVDDFRTLIGATNPEEAAAGTIRADFAESVEANAAHGSDGSDTAKEEIAFFFDDSDLCERADWTGQDDCVRA